MNASFRLLQGFALTGRDDSSFRSEFLPLTYLAKLLSDIEEQGSVCTCVCVCAPPVALISCIYGFLPALNPFEEHGNVDVEFVEETALKQTLILLGLEEE